MKDRLLDLIGEVLYLAILPAIVVADRAAAAWVDLTHEGDDAAAVWEFARQFARTSGDSPTCQCVNCRAYRAVCGNEGDA